MPTVSTQNTELLKLYKNEKLYNGSRYQYYLTNREQAFQTFLGTPAFEKTVYYKSINEPILLNEFIKDCDEITYGSITNEGKTYYFFVDAITTDAYKQTTINYTIDWWTTNWTKINCTKAHITRQPTKPHYISQPYSPMSTTVTIDEITDKFMIVATYIPNIENMESFISYIFLEGTRENIQKVQQGYWYQELGIAGSDIKDCFIVPFFEIGDFLSGLVVPPVFTIESKETIDWHATTDPAGRLLVAFATKYPCFSSDDYATDQNSFTGSEIIFNSVTGLWYHPVWEEEGTIHPRYHWILKETTDPLAGLEVSGYYSS